MDALSGGSTIVTEAMGLAHHEEHLKATDNTDNTDSGATTAHIFAARMQNGPGQVRLRLDFGGQLSYCHMTVV